MAAKEIVVDDEAKDELDEVTDIKIESEDDDDGNGMLPDLCSETLDRDTDEEIELFLKQDLKSEQNVSVDKVTPKRSTKEQSLNTTETGHRNKAGLVTDCREAKDRVDDSSEIKHRVQIEKKVPEKRNDQTEIPSKKRVRDGDVEDEKEIDYGLGIVVESGTNSLESMEHSDNVSGIKIGNKTDRNVFDVKAKDVDAEAKSMEKTSVRTYLISRDLSPLWDSYILAVKGIPPKESGTLKQVLNDVLGNNRHRVRPRQKGDTIVYVHFITFEDMRIAKETLATQGAANYKLTLTVESAEGHKSKSEDTNEGPVSKKMKHNILLQFYEEAYEKQIEFKVKDITCRLQDIEKDILKTYPTYSPLIHQRKLQHDGLICAVDKLKDCPASQRVASTCWFAIGLNEDSGQLALGIYQGSGHVRKLSSVKHNYPDHVVKAAEVFEAFLVAEEKRKICRKLLIYTNHVKDLMLLVFVHDTSHVKQVGDEMNVFFTSGDGAKCHVTSIHIKVMKSNHDIKDGAVQLVFGVPCLHETVAGFKLELPPVKNVWNTIHGAEMLCQAVEELLEPSKKMTVLDIGCGIGLLGLCLSKVAGEVLGLDTDSAVAVATKNATLNGITGCRYFAGDPEVMIPVLAKKRKYDSVCAVVTCCINTRYRSWRVIEELRKVQHLDRIVLVEDRTMSSNVVLSLNKPSSEKKMGNPFFPLKVVPVDSLPNSKGYVLLVLLERVDSDDIKKFGIDKPVAVESELNTKGGASRKPYERDSKLRLRQGDRRLPPKTLWERGAFSQQSYDTGAGPVQNSLIQNTATLSASCRQFQAADVLRAYVGTVNNLNVANEYDMRRQMEEDYRRQVMEEEHMQWLAEEEQRSLMEEMHLRQVQEEDWIRWVHDDQMRQIQEEECRRIEEEEWRRQIQEEERMRRIQEEEEEAEERMRQIQEEERMRQIQEERMRQIQEEERMRQIHEEVEECMRRIQEEEHRRIEEQEWRRQVREDEWRKHIQEEQKKIEEEEWRRRFQEDERRKQIQKEEQRRFIEEELRRKMQRESQKRPVLEETCSEQVVEEEELRRQMKEERERQLVRGSVIRSRNDLVQDLIANSRRAAAAMPQLSADAAQKVKQLVADAIRTVGALEQGERHGVVRSREVGGISSEDNTVSRFGTSDKEILPSRHMEEEYMRYIREVESGYDHSRDMSGGAVGRYSSEQNDLKPQHQAVNTKSSEKLPSLLDLKLKHPALSGENSYNAQHSSDRGFSLDVDTNQWPGRVLTARKEFDSHADHVRLTNRSLNHGKQARDLVRRDEKSTFHSVTEETSDIFMRRSDLDQEKLRSSIRRDRTDIPGTNSRNTIGGPEHSRKDRYRMVSGHPSSRPWMDEN